MSDFLSFRRSRFHAALDTLASRTKRSLPLRQRQEVQALPRPRAGGDGCAADAIGPCVDGATRRPVARAGTPRRRANARRGRRHRTRRVALPRVCSNSTLITSRLRRRSVALLVDLGRVDEAEAIFRRLVAGEAPTASAFCNLGVVLLKQGRAAEAAEILQRAVSMQPGYAIALHNLGAALTELERFDDAEQATRAALAIDDAHPVCTQQPRHAADATPRRGGARLLRPRARDRSHVRRRARPPRDAVARAGPARRRGDGAAASDHAGAGDAAGVEQPAAHPALFRRRVGRGGAGLASALRHGRSA